MKRPASTDSDCVRKKPSAVVEHAASTDGDAEGDAGIRTATESVGDSSKAQSDSSSGSSSEPCAGSAHSRRDQDEQTQPGSQDEAVGQEIQPEAEGLRYVTPYFPKACAPENPGYSHEPRGHFNDKGYEQLKVFIEEAFSRLPHAVQAEIGMYVENSGNSRRPPESRVGTVCSGTDGPVLMSKALHTAMAQKFGEGFECKHEFSCELDRPKQLFLKRMFSDRGMGALFSDAEQLAVASEQRGFDILSGGNVPIPKATDVLAGFPCPDVSDLNPKAASHSNRRTIQQADMRTGRVFTLILKYTEWLIKNGKYNYDLEESPELDIMFRCLILENVVGLMKRPAGLHPLTALPWHSNLDYVDLKLREAGLAAVYFKLDPKMFEMPVLHDTILIRNIG